MEIRPVLREAVDRGASDLHLTVGSAPVLRVNGSLVPLDMRRLCRDDTENLARQLLPQEKLQVFQELGEIDVSHVDRELGFFRANIYRQRQLTGIALRLFCHEMPTVESLGLPGATGGMWPGIRLNGAVGSVSV